MRKQPVQAGIVIFCMIVGLSCFRNMVKEQPKGVCEVHHVSLTTSMVSLDYGLPPALSNAYLAASATDFPHAVRDVNGGCVVNPFFRWARVRACAQCNTAELEWLKTHPKYRRDEEQAQTAGGDASGEHTEH